MSDLWNGTDAWAGWKVTTDHDSSSYGQPVLVSPAGTTYEPGDITSLDEVFSGSNAANEWGVNEATLKDYAAQGKFYPNEIKYLDPEWVVTRHGMDRLFKKALE